jgi:hypothetical protein
MFTQPYILKCYLPYFDKFFMIKAKILIIFTFIFKTNKKNFDLNLKLIKFIIKKKMFYLSILTICLTISLAIAQNETLYESQIKSLLFNGYDKTIQPSYEVQIGLKFSLQQIVSIDVTHQVMTTSSYLFVHWIEKRFHWNPINNASE